MITTAVHRSPGIYSIAEENPGKPQQGERLCGQSLLNWGTLHPNVGRIAQSVRKGRRQGQGRVRSASVSV